MNAHVVELRDAIVTDLQEANPPLSQSYTAKPAWLPRRKPEEVTETVVLVVARNDLSGRKARNRTEHDLVIDLGIQAAVGSTEPEDVDPLVYLAQEIHDRWRFQPVAGRSEVWKSGQWLTLAFEEHLAQHILTAVLQLTFLGYRS